MELNGLEFKRIKLSQESTKKLQQFKSRTGLTPNIACRIALGISNRGVELLVNRVRGVENLAQLKKVN